MSNSIPRPTSEEVRKYLDINEKVYAYEATQRHLRGWGCFKEEDLPSTEVQKVEAWLRQEFNLSLSAFHAVFAKETTT